MLRLYKIYTRPLFEYGSTATISATDNALAIWETNQTNYIKKVLRLPNISKENILKFGNAPTIRSRINDLTLRWYTNLYKNDNAPIIEFIDTDHRLPQNGQARFTIQKNHPTHRRAKHFPEQGTGEHNGIDNSPNSFLDENSIS